MRPQKEHYASYARERITEALLSLMERFSFHEITVLMITQEAGVARRTFYLYYETKVDVLDDYYNVLAREYDAGTPAVPAEGGSVPDMRNQALSYFRFWIKHTKYLELINRQGLFHLLVHSFEGYLLRSPGIAEGENLPELHAAFYAGGLWALLYKWTANEFRETPEELADVAASYSYIQSYHDQ